ncbi:MAG: hypothetical protein EHM61_05330 [Acidobacteria bacterium]|nr:MAG: hypothetical protein EHM61_05330 [Acidobacteriota bacterium]
MRVRKAMALASFLFCLSAFDSSGYAQTKTVCIPQFADGFDGQTFWQTQLLVDGRSFGVDRAVISVFGSRGQFFNRFTLGDFLFFNVFGQPVFMGPFTPFRFFNRDFLARPFRTGFLVIDSPLALNMRALIRRFSISGDLLSELVISPFDPFHRARLIEEEFDARILAFAMTNTDSLKRALGRFDFFPLGASDPLFSFPFEIGPRNQFSRFLFEVLPEVASSGLRGTIRITSDGLVSLLVLRVNGNEMQQVPLVIEE